MDEVLAEARAALEMIRSRPDRLSALAPFDRALADPSPAALLRRAREDGRPAVGYLCALAPLELIVAAGAVPVRLDAGSAALAERATEAVHRDCCPAVRSMWGLLATLRDQRQLQGLMPLIIAPQPCDWKAALPARLKAEFGVEVIPLDIPRTRREESSRETWRKQIRRTAVEIQRVTGAAIAREALPAAIALYRRASLLSRNLSAAMAADAPPLQGTDLLVVHAAGLLMPIAEWIEAAEALLAEAREVVARGDAETDERPRVLLAGSPCVWPHLSLPVLVEVSGGLIVADESCVGSRLFYDAVHVDETTVPDMIDAVADRYLLPCTCPVFAESEDRLVRLEALIEDFRPDGVVYHVLKSCFVYDMEFTPVRERLEETGIPVLRIETDHGETNDEALRTRLEAFVETLRSRQERPAGC